MVENEICGVCDRSKADHDSANHEFNVHGVLIQKPQITKKPASPVRVATDFVLRLLLIEKGILTSDDLANMEAKIRDQLEQARSTASDRANAGDLE